MFARGGLSGVGEGCGDGKAFVPVTKLIRVMTAAELATLAAGDEHQGVIPIAWVCDEAHGRPVMGRRGARTETGAALRFAGDAEELFEPALAA